MQSYALTVNRFLDHAARWSGEREVVAAQSGRVTDRMTYATLRTRCNVLSGALLALGLQPGDRIGTLAWNSLHHLQMYYAVMGCGLVCHTLNPRFTVAHLARIIDEAANRVLAVAANLLPLLVELGPRCRTLEHVIVLDDGPDRLPDIPGLRARLWTLDGLLETHGAATRWGDFDEQAPAGLCYTSGTTGLPKGVLYTHRSNYLHTMRALQADAMAFTAADVVLAAVPMFHANGWGLPFACPGVGARLVLPGRHTDGASLARLMREEQVTVAVGVQTLWLAVADHLDTTGDTLPDLRRLLIGGSNCPQSLIQRLEHSLSARVQTSWGMTELSPLGTIAPPDAPPSSDGAAGRPSMGLDLKLTDAGGVLLPQQREVVGHLWVRGHSVLERYYNTETDALDDDGWFHTGDLARIDPSGQLTICGRAKDLIKSGGEWINPAELEDWVGRHPDVRQVAVIGRSDVRWGERPLLIVEPQSGSALGLATLRHYLRGKVADWWIPDALVQVVAMPLAATGKIDKQRLRELHGAADASLDG